MTKSTNFGNFSFYQIEIHLFQQFGQVRQFQSHFLLPNRDSSISTIWSSPPIIVTFPFAKQRLIYTNNLVKSIHFSLIFNKQISLTLILVKSSKYFIQFFMPAYLDRLLKNDLISHLFCVAIGYNLPVWCSIQSEKILNSENHDTCSVQTEERYFVLVSTRQHLQQQINLSTTEVRDKKLIQRLSTDISKQSV